MDQDTLVNPMINAGERFLREFDKIFPLKAAYWLRTDENEAWYLYAASDRINDDNVDEAYGEVLRITSQLKNPWLDPFKIKVVSGSDPVARVIADFAVQYPGKPHILLNGATLGNVWVNGAVVYAPVSGLTPAIP